MLFLSEHLLVFVSDFMNSIYHQCEFDKMKCNISISDLTIFYYGVSISEKFDNFRKSEIPFCLQNFSRNPILQTCDRKRQNGLAIRIAAV